MRAIFHVCNFLPSNYDKQSRLWSPLVRPLLSPSLPPSALASPCQLFLNMIKFANSVKILHKNRLYFHAKLFIAYVNFPFYLNSVNLYLRKIRIKFMIVSNSPTVDFVNHIQFRNQVKESTYKYKYVLIVGKNSFIRLIEHKSRLIERINLPIVFRKFAS